jgi:hypothetical protein
MSTFRFEPIALQIARQVSIDRLLSPDGGVEEASDDEAQASLPADVLKFLSCYTATARAGWRLVGAPQFERLMRMYDRFEEEFMPGGPPMSPVYDSYATQHMLSEVPHGVANETPYSVLTRLTSGQPRHEELHRLARALADSHLDLYRVTRAEGLSAELEKIRGAGTLSVRLTGPFLRTGDRMLARVLPFGNGFFIGDSPYLLKASDAEWLEYLARASGGVSSNGTSEADPRAGSSARLTSKQRMRLRQKKQASAAQEAPDSAVVRHLKHGRSERYWLDYIMDGYAGQRRGIVYLAGVPDRPEALPHHAEYELEAESEAPAAADEDVAPMSRLRAALVAIAGRLGITAQVERELQAASVQHGLAPLTLEPNEGFLLTAFCTLAARSEQGLTALEHFERERQPSAAEHALLESLKRGWFSVWRIDRIHLDEGLEVLDVLRRKKVRIVERSATRQVALGDLLAGWVCEEANGALTLEGGLLHVTSFLAPVAVEVVKSLRDQARASFPKADWRALAAQLPPLIIVALRAMRQHMPLPELQNTSGDALQLATGRYRVRDRRRVADALASSFDALFDGAFGWHDAQRTLLASFELSGDVLLVRVNSRERLAAAKARLEQLLGDAVVPSLDVLEGDLARKAERGRTRPELPTLPPELVAQVHAAVLERISAVIDQPSGMFQGKTLRQVARGKTTRPDAVSWLREQERILRLNPQLAGLDLRPLWDDLGLEYQGLQTDP